MSFTTDGLTMVDQNLFKNKVLIDVETSSTDDVHRDHYFIQGNDDARYIYTEAYRIINEKRSLVNRYIQSVSKSQRGYHSLDQYAI